MAGRRIAALGDDDERVTTGADPQRAAEGKIESLRGLSHRIAAGEQLGPSVLLT